MGRECERRPGRCAVRVGPDLVGSAGVDLGGVGADGALGSLVRAVG
ncbi:MAG: hypothetical protein OXM87_04980 [Truepera sp.]|nr:hypothetical protein [Truepera sp.]